MLNLEAHSTMLSSPIRSIQAKVSLFEGDTLTKVCGCSDILKNFQIDRVGPSDKFFGYGICQRANVKLLDDKNRKIQVSTANTLEIEFGVEGQFNTIFPKFKVTEVNRDENTSTASITAYDAIHQAAEYPVTELGFITADEENNLTSHPYTILEFVTRAAEYLGCAGVATINVTDSVFDLSYPNGANFDGTETIRDALNAVAEATQTIYYVNNENKLVFKRLIINSGNQAAASAIEINPHLFFTLETRTNRRLTRLVHTTDAGDNISDGGVSGTTQYIRNNPFWDMRDDIGTLLDNALSNVFGLTINQFDLDWRGNYLLEIGDAITLNTGALNTNDRYHYAYVLDDVISYDGALSQQTKWNYTNDETETSANPNNIGEMLKQTYAKVDKVNREIELVASKTSALEDKMSKLEIDTDSITGTVIKVEKNSAIIDELEKEVDSLTQKVSMSITAEDVTIQVQKELKENGINSITTSTGFTFNEDGLTVSKEGTEMTTLVSEDGLSIYRSNQEVMRVDNKGVNAENLHATTYLIIGKYSRFEDYIDEKARPRTGCFWIGE